MEDYPDNSPEAQDSDDRLWGCIAHLSTLLPIPLFNLLGPLIVLMAKGDDSYFVKRQAKSALNFQLTVLIGYVVSFILVVVVIGIPMLILLYFATLILTFLAGIKAYDGKTYHYPWTIQFLS